MIERSHTRGSLRIRAALGGALLLAALSRCASAGLPVGVVSNGVARLSLEQAVMLALRKNRELQVRQFGPVIAGAFEQIERGAFDAEVFAELQYDEEAGSETSRSTGEKFTVEARDVSIEAGLRKVMSSGTEVEVGVEQVRSSSDRTPDQQEARLGVSVTQSLLAGRGPAVNLAAVRQAALGTRASRFELRGFTESLLAECETAYWRYVLAREEIAIFEG